MNDKPRIEAHVQGYIDAQLTKIRKRLDELEKKVIWLSGEAREVAGKVDTAVVKEVDIPEGKPATYSNTQVQPARPWRLQSEVMIGGSEKITVDPGNNTHTLVNTPQEALQDIAKRLQRPELFIGVVDMVHSTNEPPA